MPSPDTRPAWTADALAHDPHTDADKAGKVRRMFDAIAPSYDLNNRVHSLWQDVYWRRAAVRMANVQQGDAVVDVACGTGDLTQAFARSPAGSVLGVDYTRGMLRRAQIKRTTHARRDKITYVEGDAMALPLADACSDVVSIAFGIRNVADPAKAVREFARVLRPGGRVVVLEFGVPRSRLVRWFNDVYCGKVMPRTATLLARDTSGAYAYLPRSVRMFHSPEQMTRMLEAAGFTQICHRSMSLGICLCFVGTRT